MDSHNEHRTRFNAVVAFLNKYRMRTTAAAAFLVVFIFCSLLYYRTRKTLKKYEKEFAQELERLPEEHKKRITKSSKVIGSILASQNKLS